MTVIIASLFLPYTVQFEVSPDTNFDVDITTQDLTSQSLQSQATQARASSISVANTPLPQGVANSILPSLSIANSQHDTPADGSPRNPEALSKRNSFNEAKPQDFFYQHKVKRPSMESQSNLLTDNLNEKLGPHYIKPPSRYHTPVIPLLVVDPKKEDDGLGLSGLRINRSATNLPTLSSTNSNSNSNSTSNVFALNPGAARTRSALARGPPGNSMFSLNNASNGSLAIAEEEEDHDHAHSKTVKGRRSTSEAPRNEDLDDWKNNFNDMLHGRAEAKLAPFGGFSKPSLESGGFLCQENIFESAPWKVVLTDKGNASLTKAVKLTVEAGTIKNRKWVGTLSMPSDVVPENIINDIAASLREDYNSEAVFPNDLTFQGHYKSFCKQILWPTLHYQIPDDPKSKAFEDHSWGHYKLLNQLVADRVVEVYKKENAHLDPADPENIIWVHDYHLLLVPQMIREKLPNAKIGFFLHVSFPSSEVFRCFAQRKALLRGILGANSIAFQTEEYVRHFLQTCNRLLLADTNEFGVTYNGNFTSVTTCPVGIDANSLKDVLSNEGVAEWRKLIRERWGNQQLIVSRDKLDKLRGIKQKLLAYERFLKAHPDLVDKTVLIQICMGSANDQAYENEVMAIVGRINSLPENISVSQPVVLLHKDIDFDQYLALQCEAATFVVSSMREGLNLTCHEFVMATTEKHSPLILSEFTGSSLLLSNHDKGALLINPWDLKNFADTFYHALTMSSEEKLSRWQNCHDTVITHDSKHWVVQCLESINESWLIDQRQSSRSLQLFTRKVFEDFFEHTSLAGGKKLFFINLETPSAISANKTAELSKVAAGVADPSKTSFSEPSKVSRLLNDLMSDPSNQVYIISYMKRSDMDALFRTVPNLGLIAENGGYIKLIGTKSWVSIVDESDLENWLPQVTQLFESKAVRLPGAHCEVEDCTVRFHPGTSIKEDRERCLDVLGDTIQFVNDVYQEKDGVHATLIKNVVVVQQQHLALKALTFILTYYNNSKGLESEAMLNEFKARKLPNSLPGTPIKENVDELGGPSPIGSPLTPPKDSPSSVASTLRSKVVAVFFSGGSTPIDEPCFEYVNNLQKNGDVLDALTVTVMGNETDIKTSAQFSVAGKNELLGIVSNTEI